MSQVYRFHLKAVLRRGWAVGMHSEGDAFRATAKRGNEIARATAPEPLEAVARVIIEVQMLEAKSQ